MDRLLTFTISYISLLVLIRIAGIVLNAMMLTVLNVHSEIRTPQSILLKNLCISDLVYLLGGTVLTLMVAVIRHEMMCFIAIGFNSFAIALNIYLVAALSLQRYMSLRKFTNTHVVDEKEYNYSLGIVLGAWMLAIVLAVIECIFLRPDAETCVEGLLVGVPLYRLVMYAFLPVVVVTVLDIVCYPVLAAQHYAPNEAMAREMGGRRIHLNLVILYFLTYPPAIFTTFLVIAHLNVKYRIVILPLGGILITLNSFFHPIVMCIASKKLRVLFKAACRCRLCFQQPDVTH